MIRKADLVYATPPGMRDEHYVYAFDAVASGLVAGNDYKNLRVPTFFDSDFILRKMDGLPSVLAVPPAGLVGRFQINDANHVPFSSDPIYADSSPTVFPGAWPILPERKYPRGSEISFDLYNYQPTLYRGDGVLDVTPAAQILFYGVKRKVAKEEGTERPYRLTPYTYTLPVLFNWGLTTIGPGNIAGLDAPPRQVYVEIRNYDFELWGFHANSIPPGAAPPAAQAKLQLYDQDGQARYNQPVFFDLVDYQELIPGAAVPSNSGSAIVPPLVYGVKSHIQLDLQSYYWTTDVNFPYVVEISLFGAQRIPV